MSSVESEEQDSHFNVSADRKFLWAVLLTYICILRGFHLWLAPKDRIKFFTSLKIRKILHKRKIFACINSAIISFVLQVPYTQCHCIPVERK